MGLRLLTMLGVSLALTLALELLFALITGKRGKDLVLVCLVNVMTNPAVVLIYFLAAHYTAVPSAAVKAVLEILAVATEALIYKSRGAGFRHPLLFSLGANMFSFWTGEVISLIGG